MSTGSTTTGDVGEEKLLFACGGGANGKSVLVNVLSGLLGDYLVSVGTELLARSKHSSEADRYKASLAGARLGLLNEVGEDDVWDDQRVKELTSREKIPARMLYGEPFSFSPTHKLFIRGNHRPGVRDFGSGECGPGDGSISAGHRCHGRLDRSSLHGHTRR